MIEPKSRTVDPELLMESLFKLTELESRIPLNMNVLVEGQGAEGDRTLPRSLREWLDHRRDVLVRRSKHRLAQIEHRLEVLGGFLIAYLNLDKVIKIIRNEDEPKPVLIKTFKLTDVQADAILNMRLRNLRKLEEMEIRREDKDLREEKARSSRSCSRSEKEQWKTVADEIKKVRETFGPKTPLGKRRTDLRRSARARRGRDRRGAWSMREPITVVVSEKGWIRALRGHVDRPVGRRVQGRRRAEIRVPGRDHVEDAWCSRPTAASTRSMPPSCRAGAATASRCGCSCRYRAGRRSGRRCSAIRAAASSWSASAHGPRLRRRRGRVPRQHPQGQAGAQRQAAGRRRARSRRSRANWSPRSARTARW